MNGAWMCPRCYELGRTPVSVEIARSDVGDVRVRSTAVVVCLRCADVLWHRLRKVVGPLVRWEGPIPGGDDAEETGSNPGAVRAFPAR